MAMTQPRIIGLLFLLFGGALFIWIGSAWERTTPVAMVDFKTVYCGARALLEHRDPYNPAELQHLYLTEAAGHPSDHPQIIRAISVYIYPPTAFVLTVPFALLPWGPAHIAWMIATAATLLLAALLVWSVAATRAPIAAGLLIGLLLLTSELLIEVGNAAGIAVSLCIIAAWCFLQNRFVPLGILCFALSLLVKPHDAALVWLYFLLAGGTSRKRALQTLALTAILALPFILWTSSASPHWIHEMQANLALHQSPGGDSDPGPHGVIASTHGAQLIGLQTALSLFRDDPRFYNPATWLICAALLFLWAIAVLRTTFTPASGWMALAAVSALSMLPTYHRQQDTRLLLLLIPAFAILWSERRPIRWPALILTAAAVLFTGDIPLQLLGILATHLGASTATFTGKLTMLFLARPAPLALLATAIFYQWRFFKVGSTDAPNIPDSADLSHAEPAAESKGT
jgi:hypothetical protein